MGGPTLVIYTEDSSSDADVTMRALVERLLFQLEPNVQVGLVQFRSASGEARDAVVAQRWKGKKARGEALRRALVRELATRLKVGDFVVFHYDGDIPWGGQPGSPHDAAVAGLCADVARLLQRESLETFLRFVPHYSVESWLYLNHKVVDDLVKSGKVQDKAQNWLKDQLDDEFGYDGVSKPKDVCPLGSKWNRQLAETQWSAEAAAKSSPSWRQVEQRWASCAELMTALRQTCPWLLADEPSGES